MTRIISVLNFKGGTGKTTTVVNLGMGLALRGYRVLAIDLDPQGSVAGWLGVSFQRTLADILLNKAEWSDCVVRARVRFDVIPCDRRLADAESVLVERHASAEFLQRRLQGIEEAGYDYILLDCAPYVSLLSESALYFSREVFVPVSMEYLALVGAREVIIEVMRAQRLAHGQSAHISMVIPTFYDKRYSKSDDTLKILRDHFPGIVSAPIRASVRLSEAPSHQLTVFEYDPDGPGSQSYAEVAKRVVESGKELIQTTTRDAAQVR